MSSSAASTVAGVAAVDRVVLEQVGERRRVGQVVDGDDLEVAVPLRGRAEDVAGRSGRTR